MASAIEQETKRPRARRRRADEPDPVIVAFQNFHAAKGKDAWATPRDLGGKKGNTTATRISLLVQAGIVERRVIPGTGTEWKAAFYEYRLKSTAAK